MSLFWLRAFASERVVSCRLYKSACESMIFAIGEFAIDWLVIGLACDLPFSHAFSRTLSQPRDSQSQALRAGRSRIGCGLWLLLQLVAQRRLVSLSGCQSLGGCWKARARELQDLARKPSSSRARLARPRLDWLANANANAMARLASAKKAASVKAAAIKYPGVKSCKLRREARAKQ